MTDKRVPSPCSLRRVPGVIAGAQPARHDGAMTADPGRWPELPYAAWADTAATLQLWTQIVGKVRLALTPWLNHSWHVALYVTARGLTTGPMPAGGRTLQIDFDFIDHVLWLRTSDGQFRQIMLKPTRGGGILRRGDDRAQGIGHRRQDQHHAVRNRRTAFRSIRTSSTRPTMPITPTGSGACWPPRTT